VTWYPKAQLSDSRKQVQDIAFSPSYLGLKLASGSADGSVRIYEAIDVMNLNHWPLQEVFEVGGAGSGVTCLSWCTSRFDQPMLAVGTDTGKVQLWRYEEAVRAWQLTCELQSHALSVTDIDWAPNVGRSYHLIASCGKDRCLKVHKLPRAGGGIAAQQHYDAIPVQTASAVWRVQWNITGTILAASGEESDSVQLYKADFNGQWKCLAQLASDIAGDSMLEQNQ
jgi:nucleoporin SEH1